MTSGVLPLVVRFWIKVLMGVMGAIVAVVGAGGLEVSVFLIC